MPSPIILWNAETNAPESVEPAEAREKLASGKYTEFTAGRTNLGATQRAVDLTASDGNSLDRILLGEAASVDPYAEANAASQDFREARYDTARDKIKTFGEGIVDSMSLGLVESLTDDFGGDQRRDVRCLRDVAVPVGGTQPLRRGLAFRVEHVGDHHRGTVLRQPFGDGKPDAARGSGDDGNALLQFQSVWSFS